MPYLFLFCAKGLNAIIKSAASHGEIQSYSICRNGQKLTHLFFANGLILFSSANIHSLTIFQDFLEAFKKILGLRANPANSENFLAAVPAHLKQGILEFLKFKEGKLPVKYLGAIRKTI